MLVFTYGTLRRGQRYHAWLEGATCKGRHVTAPRYTMLVLEGYPGVVEGGRTAIVGELYEVSAAALARLDRLEEAPSLYLRRLVPTPRGSAWMYLYRGRARGRRRLPSGDWCRFAPSLVRSSQIENS